MAIPERLVQQWLADIKIKQALGQELTQGERNALAYLSGPACTTCGNRRAGRAVR